MTDLADGITMEIIRVVCEQCLAMLMADLGVMPAAKRDAIMTEFDSGSAFLLQQLELEFVPFQSLPLKIIALGHHNQAAARAAIA